MILALKDHETLVPTIALAETGPGGAVPLSGEQAQALSRSGGVAVNGLLLHMPQVFEDFVCTALREELGASYGGSVRTQLVRHLDLAGQVVLKPDLVWMRRGRVEAVVDAKYKAEQPAGYPNADLYQLLAYCTALGLPRGHLVYAAGSGEPAVHTIRSAGVEIVCHALDLATPPAQLLSQMRDLGSAVTSAALV
jgi:5-methylcytosine-specific restriction enzyme subunit McrC